MLGYLPCSVGAFDCGDEKADPRRELAGGPLEHGQRVVVVAGLARRVGNAPVNFLLGTRKLRADLADAIAERDDAVEAAVGEFGQALRTSARDVDPALAHDADGVRMERLRIAARARRCHSTAGKLLTKRLGDLRPRTVPRTQKE